MQKSAPKKLMAVRPRSARKIPLWFCLLMAGLAGAIVYWRGLDRCAPASVDSSYTATAYVVERSSTPNSVEIQIPIAYSDPNQQHAKEVVNALADRYVEDRNTEWQKHTEKLLSKDHEATEILRSELAENEKRFKEFRKQITEKDVIPQADLEQNQSQSPATIDNPEWLDLNRRLFVLKQRHDAMLIDRTPLHPAVQDLAMQIEDAKEQMAAIPRQIPQKLPSSFKRGTEDEGGKSPKPFAIAKIISDQDQQKLNELTKSVESSRLAYAEAEAAEKKALAQQLPELQYFVVYAEEAENAVTSNYGWRRLMVTTLMAGMFMVFGVGAFSAGVAIDPPVGTIGQIQKSARVPVLGTIPAKKPISDPESLNLHQSQERLTLFSIGLILMAACPVVAYWGISGM
jgi:murein DD-endopeptidase MepM/ murein hydrolase activator NlpD